MNLGVFIDLSNFYYCTNRKYGRKVDYNKLMQVIKQNVAEPKICMAYGTHIKNEAIKFRRMLMSYGYITNFFKRAKKQKLSLNVNMTIDIIKLINEYDTIIIGTTDINMMPLIKFLQSVGKNIIVLGCGIPKLMDNFIGVSLEIGENVLEDVKNEVAESSNT